jgi:hypothetical protein
MSTKNTAWQTNRRYGYGFREDRMLTLVAHRGVFLLLSENVEPIPVETLDQAIAHADKTHPPAGWSHVVGLWLHAGWKIQPAEGGWAVFDDEGDRKSKQVFARADLARKWCEVRQDRVGINLRGPKPKLGNGAEVEPVK